jgi:hypothetical protein
MINAMRRFAAAFKNRQKNIVYSADETTANDIFVFYFALP